ncbi:RlfB protein [Pasteurellaceae bacterium LIM206]|nr:RlfB protein [Pasteurellaceae bacterium LIM206]
MFNEPLDLSSIDATQLIDTLYKIFYQHFIKTKTYLAGCIYINPKCYDKEEGKERVFWHLITKEQKEKVFENGKAVWKEKGRYLDYARASRLEWIKTILDNHQHTDIKLFYHQETNAKKNIRLYLWAYQQDFVVILQKLGKSSSYLVTSFYIEHKGKRKDYQKRFERY